MNAQLQTETAPVITVRDILQRYERECLHDLAPRTQRDYRRNIAHLITWFGSLVALELEPRTFADFLNCRRGKTNRVRQLAVLSAALTIAVRRWFWIKTNVLRDVERPKSKPRDRLVLDEEFHACRAIATPRMRLAMDLALLTGQRQGDIISFKWSDLREEVIEGRRVSYLHVFQSKTKKRLAIEVTPDLERVLDACWVLEGRCEYVLPTRFGVQYTPAGFRAYWQRTIRRYIARGGENFHFHDLRALAATKCATLEEAQQLLGHTSPAMTRRVYRRGVERVRPLSMSVVRNDRHDASPHPAFAPARIPPAGALAVDQRPAGG